MAHVFISYSRADEEFIEKFLPLAWRMFPEHDFWYDDHITGGEDWWKRILAEIEQADLFIYLLSNDSLESTYCQAKFREAQRLQKQILPVIVRRLQLERAPDDIQAEIRRLNWVDMARGFRDVEAYTRLQASIKARLALVPEVPPPPIKPEPIPEPAILDHPRSRRLRWLVVAAIVVGLLPIAAESLISTWSVIENGSAETPDVIAAAQTALATLWTHTPTPNITTSMQAVLTSLANETATQNAVNMTATATLWTNTPTAINTPTPSDTLWTPTPTPSPTAAATLPSLGGATLTGVAYSDDPNTSHVATWGANPVFFFSGPLSWFRVCNGGTCTGYAVATGNPAQMGGFRWFFESANNGDNLVVNEQSFGSSTSCQMIHSGGYRYCGVAPPSAPSASALPASALPASASPAFAPSASASPPYLLTDAPAAGTGLWTPTPNRTASVEAVLTSWANETATQAAADLAATAMLWTPPPPAPPTPTLTSTGTETPDPMVATQTVFAQQTAQAIAGTSTATLRTPTPTPTATSNPTHIANITFAVHSISGNEIGNGHLKIFYDDEVAYPQTGRVELELFFDNYYITPTPFGPRTVIPVGTYTPTPPAATQTPLPTLTPRVPRFETSQGSVEFYELMGVSLVCSSTSFTGCEEKDQRLITLNGVKWEWIIHPQKDIRGSQALRLELWRLISVGGGPEQKEVVWTYSFHINVIPEDTGSIDFLRQVSLELIGVIGTILAALIGAGILFRRQKSRPNGEEKGAIVGREPRVFISYNRSVSAGYGVWIRDRLKEKGGTVFIDVEDIHAGAFEDYIKKDIEKCDYFIVILAPGTLQSEWVVKETRYAFECKRTVIPVLVNNFNLYGDEVPQELKQLKKQNAITITAEHQSAAIEKLLRFIGLLPS